MCKCFKQTSVLDTLIVYHSRRRRQGEHQPSGFTLKGRDEYSKTHTHTHTHIHTHKESPSKCPHYNVGVFINDHVKWTQTFSSKHIK